MGSAGVASLKPTPDFRLKRCRKSWPGSGKPISKCKAAKMAARQGVRFLPGKFVPVAGRKGAAEPKDKGG